MSRFTGEYFCFIFTFDTLVLVCPDSLEGSFSLPIQKARKVLWWCKRDEISS